jgi:hypothetical protein
MQDLFKILKQILKRFFLPAYSHLSVRMEQLGSHLKNFRKILNFSLTCWEN